MRFIDRVIGGIDPIEEKDDPYLKHPGHAAVSNTMILQSNRM